MSTMSTHEIPRDQWRQELDSFSRSYEGWLVRVTVKDPDGRSHVAAQNVPLQGVTAEVDTKRAIDVMVGDEPANHMTHEVHDPVSLAFEMSDAGITSALCVGSSDGTVTTVAFQTPARPEEVDGIAFPS